MMTDDVEWRVLVNIVMIMESVIFRTKFAAALTENEDIAEKVIETVPLGRFGAASHLTLHSLYSFQVWSPSRDRRHRQLPRL